MPRFKNNLNIEQNQLVEAVLHKGTAFPTTPAPVSGQLFYRSDTDKPYYYSTTGSTWVEFSNQSITADDVTLEIVAGVVRIKDGGVSTAKIGDGQVTTIKVANGAITFAKFQSIPTMTLVGRVAAGTGVATSISILDSATMTGANSTNVATAGSIVSYVDSRISSIGTLVGAFNANTATNFPGGAGVFKGNYWYVTVAGTVQGVVLNIGDVLIANKDTPSTTLAADWIFLESNRDQATNTVLGVVMLASNAETQTGTDALKAVTSAGLSSRTATESRTGLAALASTAMATAGTNDTTIMTPLKTKQAIDAALVNVTFALNIGDGTATSFTVTHNRNSRDISISVYENAAPYEEVHPDVFRTTVNASTITYSRPPALNSQRVVVKL